MKTFFTSHPQTPLWRSFLLGVGLLVAATSAWADTSNLKAYDVTGGKRGESTQFNVRLVLDGHAAGAGWRIMLFERSAIGERPLGTLITDGKGWVRLQYAIPKNPRADNVFLYATFPGGTKDGMPGIQFTPAQSDKVRVPIGH